METQPATLAQAVHPDRRPGLPDPDPELPLYGEVSEGGADFSDHALGAVSANIDRLIDQVGGEPPFKIGCHTFRHGFAVHLLLHGRPLKFVSQLLGHRSVESTERCTPICSHSTESIFGRF